ncbi:nucleoside phosphorylase domain-containing protein [Aspergillus stella-maris]|uniref:nucleoside phosphorylase domain-containing protein n=1 Tax=Aspergillus stella-maris TaxID=1810926 RepID=UPI003CCD80FB
MVFMRRMLGGNFRTRRNSIFTPFSKQGPSGVIQGLAMSFSRPAIFISITEALGRDCDDLNCNKEQQIRCREISEDTPASIHIGLVASADTVMKSGQHRDEIVKKEKVYGFEMEGAGVWDNVPCLIIKGVCDYADSHKSKVWQAYAAATGASAAKAFLEYWMPANHNDEFEMWAKGSPIAPPLKNIIPRSENGHVLFTFRNRQLALKLAGPNVVSVPNVDQKSKEIFRKLLMREDLLQEDYQTSALLEQLAFLPLAISQAAAYINQTEISLARYMSLLGQQEESTIAAW